ncbi:MAG: hypothetical protein A2Z83_00970 [Omnitrophica bacterium GWA2_52_8]|nr:MAG: hypothetical protein A2Z83_00970 [Omnitrophica bacterium GWA2_52_8]
MIEPEEIQQMLQTRFDGAEVTVQDMTGTRDHFEAVIVWPGFRGKSLIDQHQLVNGALSGPLNDGRIHALKIKTIVS